MASEDNKDKIVETALRMFNERGLKGATMDDIASELRMSKRTLYEAFAGKEELLTECLNLVQKHTNERHRQAHQRSGEPLLVAMYMLRTNALFIHKYRRLIEETERYYPEIHHRFLGAHTDGLREKMQYGMDYVRKQGYLRADADIDVAIDFFCALTQHKRLAKVGDRDDCIRRINEMCFTYLRGLMNTETLARYDSKVGQFEQVMHDLEEESEK